MTKTLSNIFKHKIVAIIRGWNTEDTLDIVNALHNGGVRIVEVTLNSPEPYQSISAIAERFGNDIEVGAGTVIDADMATKAIDAGAKFIISPNCDEATISVTKKRGAVSIPGGFTPSEILQAYNYGADIVKVFPSILGPNYIKNIKGPYSNIALMPTGGVTLDNMQEYLDAGAVSFGIAGGLLKSNQQGAARLKDIESNAMAFINALK